MKKLLLQPWIQLATQPWLQAGLGSHLLALGWPGAPWRLGVRLVVSPKKGSRGWVHIHSWLSPAPEAGLQGHCLCPGWKWNRGRTGAAVLLSCRPSLP